LPDEPHISESAATVKEIAVLETPRLILRGVTEDDAPAIQARFNDYAVIAELARRVPWPYPKDGAATFIREHVLPKQGNDHWIWGIVLKAGPPGVIGVVDLWRSDTTENRGFWLAREFWGRGYMTEATDAVTDYAFDVLGFETLVLSNALGNLRSRRVKEKAGAVLVRLEPAEFVNPAYKQREVWALTKQAWKGRK
jgi:RimJ/RimL family protein N-acetyltransferase